MMPILPSERVSTFKESITLKLNAEAISLAKQGHNVINLTAGQLPFKPDSKFIDSIKKECNFLSSFQYSPVPGQGNLKEKLMKNFYRDNNINNENNLDVIISNGAKQSISNILCALLNPGDEVIIFTPYWVSYRPLIELYGGVVKVVESDFYDSFSPELNQLESLLSSKTKAIIVNSPSNPSGVIYSNDWMDKFGEIVESHPDVTIISDEIYRDLTYYDPAPKYFYQERQGLLNQTIIVGGISKSMAATGLRVGWAIAPKDFVGTLSKLQGQLTSGANSLIQSALVHYDLSNAQEYLNPIKVHLRENSKVLRDKLKEADLSHKWYQVRGAFYYILDFNKLPIHERFIKSVDDPSDYGHEICTYLLKSYGVACVPGTDFGLKNCARISLVSPNQEFESAVDLIIKACLDKEKTC